MSAPLDEPGLGAFSADVNLTCPYGCDEPLVAEETGLTCPECDTVYPVLGGAPLLVPAPGLWLARHREAVLATLAERGSVDRAEVAALDAVAAPFRGVEPERFSDDWVRTELSGDRGAPRPAGSGAAVEAYGRFLDAAAQSGPGDVLLELLPDDRLGVVAELGPGAGALTRRLAPRCDTLYTVDMSLRSALTAAAAATAEQGQDAQDVRPLVGDAENLPFRDETLDALVAENVVDLLDDPGEFAEGLRRVLRPGGVVVLSTPDPTLEDDRVPAPDAVAEFLDECGLEVEEVRDGVPWLRPHGPRHYEVYFCRVYRARA